MITRVIALALVGVLLAVPVAAQTNTQATEAAQQNKQILDELKAIRQLLERLVTAPSQPPVARMALAAAVAQDTESGLSTTAPPKKSGVLELATKHALQRSPSKMSGRPPKPQTGGASSRPHRFFDTTNNLLTVAGFGAQFSDAASTLHGIKLYGGHEGNPVTRPFIEAGWPGTVAGVSLLVSLDVGLRYWAHRTNHHRVERWIPSFLVVTGTSGWIRNVRLMNDLERVYGPR